MLASGMTSCSHVKEASGGVQSREATCSFSGPEPGAHCACGGRGVVAGMRYL
jgi:nitrogenase subunit NifH